jgi:hypothetical protein
MNRLAAMEAFVRVIDTGSFSSAARQLRIGQPSISKAIARFRQLSRHGTCSDGNGLGIGAAARSVG